MNYGFSAYNRDGEAQIDGKFNNFVLSQALSITPYSGYDNSGFRYVYYNDTGSTPIVGFKVTSDTPSSIGFPTSNRACLFKHYNHDPTMDIAVFKPTTPSDSSGYGMSVYNESGQIVFSSNNKYLKIHSVNGPFPFNIYYWGGVQATSYTFTVKDADNHYFFIAPFGNMGAWGLAVAPMTSYEFYAPMLKKINSTTITLSMSYYYRLGQLIWPNGLYGIFPGTPYVFEIGY